MMLTLIFYLYLLTIFEILSLNFLFFPLLISAYVYLFPSFPLINILLFYYLLADVYLYDLHLLNHTLNQLINHYKYHGLCSGLDYESQKVKLVEIVTDLFSGITNSEERPRLHWIPATKDSRRGGIWLDIGFNGDEFKEVVVKKNRLDLQMRDAYDSLFNAGCADLSEVSITAIQKEITTREIGSSMLLPVVVFKTTLRKAQADEVDWKNKDNIDFNEVWRQLVLNPRWRKAIRESNEK